MDVFKGKMPDITQAQVVAAVTWIIAQAVAWGWVNNEAGQKLLAASASLIAVGWMLADSYLRGQRANARATAIAAGRHLSTGERISDTGSQTAGQVKPVTPA